MCVGIVLRRDRLERQYGRHFHLRRLELVGPFEPDPLNVIGSVSCSSSSFCGAADNAGNVLTFNGSSWSAPTPLAQINALSCPTSSFCVAVTNGDAASTYNGAAWSSPVTILPGGGLLESVSCSSSSFCAAVTQADQALMYDGSGWSGADRIVIAGDGSTQLTSVSCSAGPFCAAVDHAGNALTYPVTSSTPTTAPPATEPLAPTDLRAIKVTDTAITLGWATSKRGQRPAAYVISKATRPKGRFSRVGEVQAAKTRYLVKHLRPRRRYRFRIQAVAANGTLGHTATWRWIATR